MINHLSQDQFETCILGEAGKAELEHIHECSECRAELEHFRKVVSMFRTAVWDRVDDRVASQARDAATFMPAAHVPRWQLALVAAGFVAVIMIPFFMTGIQPRKQVEPVSAEMTPEAVMERLNRHLSRTMPAPMEPVMSLIPSEAFASKPGRVQ